MDVDPFEFTRFLSYHKEVQIECFFVSGLRYLQQLDNPWIQQSEYDKL